MKTLTDHLTQYAAYHQDARNVATHFVGIPMIVLGVATLLSRPAIELGGVSASPTLALVVISCLFYLRLDLRFGAVMALLMVANLGAGQWLAGLSTSVWLASGVGLFVVGWAVQFLGHYYEGKKPAFVDDLVGLLVGPLFLVAETAFALQQRMDIKVEIERRLGCAIPAKAGVPA
jgi:uncharacterized membrane protein YGL010W